MNRLALTLVALVVGTAALAQPPQGGGQGGQGGQGGEQGGGGRGGRGGRGGGQGGPGGGFGGGPGGGGFGGAQGGFPGGGGGFGGGMMGGMMGMSRELTALNIPLRVMTYYLNLTDAQAGKIALIREDMQDAARPQMPQRRTRQDPNADPSADPNAQGGRPDMQAMMQEMQANVAKAERKATTDTNATLSEPQRTRLSLLIKALKSLQGEGVRPEAATKLLLNEDQLTALSRSRKMDTVLTPEQLTIAQSYLSPMGRGGFGGAGGGFGGGPGGGQGGPGGASGRGGRGGGGQGGGGGN